MKLTLSIKEALKKRLHKEGALYALLAKLRRRPLPEFFHSGFHGDHYLIAIADALLNRVDQFIETGSSTGSTIVFVAEKFPSLPLWGCEPDKNAFSFARTKTGKYPNIHLIKKVSPDFLYDIAKENRGLTAQDTLFWLDAHANGFSWPLKKEIAFITSHFEKAYILIDDFLVPGRPWFGYDAYDGQVCSMDFIRDSLDKKQSYTVYYPTYRDQTSAFCKLRGWVLIEFGHGEPLPALLLDKVEKSPHVN